MIYVDLQEVGLFEVFKGVIAPLLIVFLLELAYRDILMEISKDSVPDLQDNFSDADGPKDFLEVVVVAGSMKALLLIMCVAFVCMDKASAMYLWSSTYCVYFLANIL